MNAIYGKEFMKKFINANLLRMGLVLLTTVLMLLPSQSPAQVPLQIESSSQTVPGSHFKKVVWIVFENTDFKKVMEQKDFFRISQFGASMTQMIASTHPSQGNYIAMIAGSTLGVTSDSPIDLNAFHLGDLLERKGLSWRVYAEDYPGNCFTGKKSKNYVRKHVPFMSFINVTRDPKRCAFIESDQNFNSDFTSRNLPNFSMYIPNLINDGHDTNVDYAGRWLTAKFGNLLTHPEALEDILFIITFDESGFFSLSNQIYTVLIGSQIIPGSQFSSKIGHAALLKLIEDEYGLGNLGREDSTSPSITGIWKNRSSPNIY